MRQIKIILVTELEHWTLTVPTINILTYYLLIFLLRAVSLYGC